MLCEQPDDYRDLIQRMTSLQIRLSGEEQNLARQRQLIRSLKTSIASKIPSENHDEPSLQALQAQVSELVSKLDPSWQVALDLERASSVSPNAQPEAGDDTTILHWSLAIAGTSRQLYNENDDKSNKDLQLTNTKGTRKSMGNVSGTHRHVLSSLTALRREKQSYQRRLCLQWPLITHHIWKS